MKFSVCIPTWNRAAALQRTLRAALAMHYTPTEFEVIVVVDGSTDATLAMLDAWTSARNLRVITQDNRGLPAARNRAIHEARGEYVLLLDDDIICEPDVLLHHDSAHARAENETIVFGRVPLHGDSPPGLASQRWQRWYDAFEVRAQRESSSGVMTPLWLAASAPAVNRSIRRRTLLNLGGFDEQLRDCHEDWDFGIRAWRAGISMLFEPRAIAWHLDTKTANDMVRRDGPALGRAEVALARKHPEYRPLTVLSSMGDGSTRHRAFARVGASLPMSIDPALAPIYAALNATRTIHPLVRGAGLRLLAYRRDLEVYRAAAMATGSPESLRAEFAHQLPALCYHHVGIAGEGSYPDLTLSPDRFAQHVRWLVRCGYHGITLDAWVAWVRHGVPLPRKPVLITFDDAYADIAEHALPVLRAYGMPATVFVVTGCVGGVNRWDVPRGGAQHALMDATTLRAWADQGIAFGAHSRTHPDLTCLPLATAQDEILGSKADLEAILGRQVSAFAYPFGRYNAELADIAGQAFDAAVTTRGGLNALTTPLHELRRRVVGRRDTGLDLVTGVTLGFMPAQSVRRGMRHLVPRSRATSSDREHIFLDCGAQLGQALVFFRARGELNSSWAIHAFEPNPACDAARRIAALRFDATVHQVAVWTSDALIPFRQENHARSGSGSLSDGNSTVDGWGSAVLATGARAPGAESLIPVRAIDFSRFVRSLPADAEITCKMNIAGSEFEVLRRMICDGTIERIRRLYVEFHPSMVPGESQSSVDDLVRDMRRAGVLVDTQTIHRIPYAVPHPSCAAGV